MTFTASNIPLLGPLTRMIGTWEGDKGLDIALDDDRSGSENNLFRERISFVPFDAPSNHEQYLAGLRYNMIAWRIDEKKPFHEEYGYWLWDAADKQIMRAFVIPRGISILAGGTAENDANEFDLVATHGSTTYGVCANPFLDREFKIVRFSMKVKFHADQTFSYDQDTQIQVPGKPEIFHHRDRNTLKRI